MPETERDIFPTAKYFFDPDAQRSSIVYLANRWHLEPSDPEAFAAGELVDPVRRITFYIDDTFPEKWKPYIKEGVHQWSEVFEEIGYRNAVVAADFPDDDPEKPPLIRWRGAGSLLYSNWLNYFVYQRTPYDLSTL